MSHERIATQQERLASVFARVERRQREIEDDRWMAKRCKATFCPNIAATPDGKQVWFTLKDTGKTEVFAARPPFSVLKTLDTGPITNHVNIVHNAHGTFAYVTVGGLDEVKVF